MKSTVLLFIACCSTFSLFAQNSLDFVAKGNEIKGLYQTGEKQANRKPSFDPSTKGLEAGYKVKVENDRLTVNIPAQASAPVFKLCCFSGSPLGASDDICLKVTYNATQNISLKFNFLYYAEKGDEKTQAAAETVTLPATQEDKSLTFDLSSRFEGNYKALFYFYTSLVTPLQEAGILNIKRVYIGKK
jgi:hypothetical protein